MKVGFCSLGCKVNAYETEYAINEFKKRGYEIVSFDDYAANKGNVTKTSEELKISTRQLWNKISQYKIDLDTVNKNSL